MICPLVQKDGKPSPCLRDRCAWWMTLSPEPRPDDKAVGCAVAFAGIPSSGRWNATINGGGRDDG